MPGAMLIALAAALALPIAVGAPLPTTVVGLIGVGILHTLVELRYVLGRFGGELVGRYAGVLVALITGIVLARLGGAYLGAAGRTAEILLGYAVLAVAVHHGLRRWGRVSGYAVLAAGLAASLTWPAYHAVVLAHLHNLVPLVFLWEWSARVRSAPVRRVFRGVQVLWCLVVPAVVLAGGVDRWVSTAPGVVQRLVGDGASVLGASAPPGAGVMGVRLLVTFAFLQTMHYVVWVGFFPRVAPQASAAVRRRWPWWTRRRMTLVALGAAALFGGMLLADYGQGRTVYSGLASYHAYLEFPVVLALAFRGRSS